MTRPSGEDWGAVGETWERDRPQRVWRAHSDAMNERLLRAWLPGSGGRVLKTDAFDEAFGRGLAPALMEWFDRLWVIDVAAPVLRAALRRCPEVRAAGADVRRLPFPDACWDSVVSLSTLDHFDGTAQIRVALGEIARVLRPGGSLIVTFDNPLNPVVALRNRLPWPWLSRIGLVPYYVGETLGRGALEDALDEAGFDVLEVEAIQHVPRAPAVAAAWVVSRIGGEVGERAFLRAAAAFERLRAWPTRFQTGYFLAALAVRR